MPQTGGPGWPGIGGPALPDSGGLDTLPGDLGSDLAHLFDYCRGLLGQDAEAARTARSVLDAEHEPLPDRERLRAWLFGLARSLALALRPPGNEKPPYMPGALTAASRLETDNGVQRAFTALGNGDREILDLVYRHGIRPADLPAVLILPAEEVYRRLAHAEEEFISLATGPEAGPGADLGDIAALPLSVLPASDDGEGQLQGQPARPVEGAGARRPLSRRRVQFATAFGIPVAAVLGLVVFGSIPVPALCGPSGEISLAKGGTFTATLG